MKKTLTEFPYGIWNYPLVHYAQNRRPSGWLVFMNFPPAEDSWVNADDLDLPANVSGEEIAIKANVGALYVPDLDHLAPVRGTKLAPLTVKPLPGNREPQDQATWSMILPYGTQREIAAAIEAYDDAHSSGKYGEKWIRMENGRRYAALRPNGELMLITAFGPVGKRGVQLIPIGNIEDGVAAEETIAPEFGAVIERVVNDDGAGRDFLIDLDSGELFTPPEDLSPRDEAAFLRWMEGNGIDAMGETNTSVRGLVGIQMKATPIASARWETISAAEVEADPSLREASAGSHIFLSAKGDLPETFLFETREGGRGVLQIVEFAEDPRGVRIRYKMVGSDARSAPGGQAASVVPTPVAPEANEVSWWEEPEVSVTQYGPDHLSFRGASEEFMDACRTVLHELGYKEDLGENRVRHPYYRESGSLDASAGNQVAGRIFFENKDEHGAEYRVTFVFLEGKDPVVMLENTSEDKYRLINALDAEFARQGFPVESR